MTRPSDPWRMGSLFLKINRLMEVTRRSAGLRFAVNISNLKNNQGTYIFCKIYLWPKSSYGGRIVYKIFIFKISQVKKIGSCRYRLSTLDFMCKQFESEIKHSLPSHECTFMQTLGSISRTFSSSEGQFMLMRSIVYYNFHLKYRGQVNDKQSEIEFIDINHYPLFLSKAHEHFDHRNPRVPIGINHPRFRPNPWTFSFSSRQTLSILLSPVYFLLELICFAMNDMTSLKPLFIGFFLFLVIF